MSLPSGARPRFFCFVLALLGAPLCGCSDDASQASADGAPAELDAQQTDAASTTEPDAAANRSEASTPADAPTPEGDASDAKSQTADAANSLDSMSGSDAQAPEAGAVCATGPFVNNPVTVSDVSTSTTPLPGATVKASVCGASQLTDANGLATLMIPSGIESYLRLEAPGTIPTLYPMRTLTSAQTERLVILDDKYKVAYFPDYDAGKAEILVIISGTTGATPPCNAYDGVTISVLSHPEAVVTYWMGGIPNEKAVGAMATTATGVATITGIAAGTEVVLDLKKPTCTVAYDYPNTLPNPKLPLETGGVTFFGPRVKN